MNVNLIRLKGVITELRAINSTLNRLADCLEADLASKGVYLRPPVADTRGDPPELSYTNEEDDYLREVEEQLKRQKGVDVQKEDL